MTEAVLLGATAADVSVAAAGILPAAPFMPAAEFQSLLPAPAGSASPFDLVPQPIVSLQQGQSASAALPAWVGSFPPRELELNSREFRTATPLGSADATATMTGGGQGSVPPSIAANTQAPNAPGVIGDRPTSLPASLPTAKPVAADTAPRLRPPRAEVREARHFPRAGETSPEGMNTFALPQAAVPSATISADQPAVQSSVETIASGSMSPDRTPKPGTSSIDDNGVKSRDPFGQARSTPSLRRVQQAASAGAAPLVRDRAQSQTPFPPAPDARFAPTQTATARSTSDVTSAAARVHFPAAKPESNGAFPAMAAPIPNAKGAAAPDVAPATATEPLNFAQQELPASTAPRAETLTTAAPVSVTPSEERAVPLTENEVPVSHSAVDEAAGDPQTFSENGSSRSDALPPIPVTNARWLAAPDPKLTATATATGQTAPSSSAKASSAETSFTLHGADVSVPQTTATIPGGLTANGSSIREAKIAADSTGRPLAAQPLDRVPPKKVQGTTLEHVSGDEPGIGTDIAKPTPVMAAAPLNRRHSSVESDAGPNSVAAPAPILAAQRDSAPLPVTISNAAHRAVEAVISATERFSSANNHSVSLQFAMAGVDLTVRVELRGGEVHTTFRTDSEELRGALAQEWQAMTGTGQTASLRIADPVFGSTTSASANPFTGDSAAHQQRDPHARQAASDQPSRELARGGSPGHAEPEVPPHVPRLTSLTTALHLHTFA